MPTVPPPLTDKEKEFAKRIAAGDNFAEAARKVFRWRCVTGTKSYERAKTLSRSARVKKEVATLKAEQAKHQEMANYLGEEAADDWTNIVRLMVDRLISIRDDSTVAPRYRFKAIKLLEKIEDPNQSLNLVWRYVDLAWDGLQGHCPSCHNNFPLWQVKNQYLREWRLSQKGQRDPAERPKPGLEQRLRLLRKADNRNRPHKGQLVFLSAPERHMLGVGSARCIEENELIPLANGKMVFAKELINQSFEVVSYGPVGEQRVGKAFGRDNGVQPVYRVQTDNGRHVTRTAEHPFLQSHKLSSGQGMRTQVGRAKWAPLEDIKVGDLVAVPTQISIEGRTPIADETVKLIALLLGDGSVKRTVNFTQIKTSTLFDEFIKLVEFHGCDYRIEAKFHNPASTIYVRGKEGERNHILDLVRSIGLFGLHSRDKKFPDIIWSLPNRQLSLFLRYLYGCDGWATKGEVGYCSASERLIDDVEMACLRLGVCGIKRYKLSSFMYKGEKKSKPSWFFEIFRAEFVKKFADTINIAGKEPKVQRAKEIVSNKPMRDAWKISGLPEGYEWQIVRKIDYVGERPTVSITVDTYENFITTFVEHNCGKSVTLGMFAFLFMMIPGVEVWLLARIYDDAESELEYLNQYLKTAFYPVAESMYQFDFDKKTGEAKITTRWGSVLKIKSSKAKGSITGRELEAALVAEPAWIDGDLFEEVRARMSSRLGRIIALGTPKGLGGFVGRMQRMTSRDVRTGRKLPPGAKLIANGCPWGQSIFTYHMKPIENPAYVQSELEAARMELTESEYASEFEGLAVPDTTRKFPHVNEEHLITFPRHVFDNSVVVTGFDQGPRNFGGCTVAWDGHILRVVDEYFDNTDRTIKSNLIHLNQYTPGAVRLITGDSERWKYTIFDVDPLINNELIEMDDEGRGWKTEFTFRPKGKNDTAATWREETCQWLDQLACDNRLYFCAQRCDLLHEQVRECLNPSEGTGDTTRKRWIVNDPIRKDHVMDALILACWVVYSQQVTVEPITPEKHDPFEEARRAQEVMRRTAEKRELTGMANESEIFEEVFGRSQGLPNFFTGVPGYWADES